MNGLHMYSSQDCSNNNANPMSPKSKIPQLRSLKSTDSVGMKESIYSPKPPHFPKEMTASLSRTSSREDVAWSTSHVEKWKRKYEEADRKCKSLLVKNEKTLREQNDLERRHQLVLEEKLMMQNQILEKDVKLNKLRAVSEKVYKEYDQLKNQYDVETQAMHKAMQSAGQWYQQNRRLKRRSAALLQRLPPQVMQDWDALDAADAASESSGGEELEGLRETVAELSREVGRLQTEISSLKLQEFEVTEANVNLIQELEQERANSFTLEERLKNAIEEVDRSKRLARHLATEVSTYREQLEQYKSHANNMMCEAESAKKERDMLVHRNSLYLDNIFENGEFLNKSENSRENEESLLKELDNLRAQLEQERIYYSKEIEELQEKLLDKENSDEMFLLEEKLNLAEDDVKKAIERAEKAEKLLNEYENKRMSIAKRVALFESPKEKVDQVAMERKSVIEDISVPPPPPFPEPLVFMPPPPPPPPPPPSSIVLSNNKTNDNAIADMANLLGIKQNLNPTKKPSGGAIDEIVNQIKGGRFHLKSTEQKSEKKPKDEPAALKELRNILGTLKRRPKSCKESNKENSEEKNN